MIALLLACAPSEPLRPSRDLSDDAMLRALQSDATVLAGLDGHALLDAELTDAVLGGAPLDPNGVFGPVGLVPEDLDRWRLGCGSSGCAVLVEGDLSGVAWNAARRVHPDLRPARRGVDAVDAHGDRYALRVLSHDKGIAGDRAAVRELARLRGGDLDVGALDGLVPDGQLWTLIRDPDRFVDQARARLRSRPEPLAALERAVAEHPEVAERVRAVAASVDVDDAATLTVRVALSDELTARLAEKAARDALADPPENLAPILDLAEITGVGREGTVVDVWGTWR